MAIVFGTYTFPRSFHVSEDDSASQVPVAKLPRYDGARVPLGFLDRKTIRVRGGIVKGPLSTFPGGITSVQGQMDAIKAGITGRIANLTVDANRYWRNCQKSTLNFRYDPTHYGRMAMVDIEFLSGDPFQYEVATQSASQVISATPTTFNVAGVGGNASALPVISITIGATGTLAATITNNTTGEQFTLAGAVTSGDVIVIDSLNQTVTRSSIDVTSLFDGSYPSLAVGTNSWTVAYTSSTITGVSYTWTNRWY